MQPHFTFFTSLTMNYQTSAKPKATGFTRIELDSSAPSPVIIRASNKQIITALFSAMCLLIMFSLVADYLLIKYPPASHPDNHVVKKYIQFFYLNNEDNLPTLFSVVLLFIAALLNFTIGLVTARDNSKKKQKWYWYTLCAMFLFLGLDEGLQIHDMLGHVGPMETMAKESSLLLYGWVVPYAAGVLVAGFLFLRFVLNLPAKTRNWFIISGTIYVGGALGLELVESWAHVNYGNNNMLERAMYTIEETMEMTGSILFIYALLDYIGLAKASFTIGKFSLPAQTLSVSVAG